MQEIHLKNSGVAFVDDTLYPALVVHEWFAVAGKDKRFYAARRERAPNGGYRTVHLHHTVAEMRMYAELPDDVIVTFKDRNGMNCQAANLLLTTTIEHLKQLAIQNSKC